MRWIVMIVDDHPLVGEAFELSIRAAYPHMDVGRVTSAADAETYARANAARIALVMLDLMLPDATGFSALLQLQQILPGKPIAIVSARADAHSIAMARTFGVAAYLSKSAPVSELVNAVGDILRGEAPFSEPAEEAPAEASFRDQLASLSATQLRVLVAMADGRLNKQIAAEMDITEGTVKQHVSAIFRKLAVNNRTQAILAIRPYLNDLVRD
ncbi:DNA-binding NarL/FixJ family response regulator [Brevundimonas alba]|uniref:DNA-binding NarL/FixJ family response regulator n=1 Tax=Brevundimonas alba TaxID=74314 RepID=A0A7X5YL81_9CAUL|nr:response regulator transcription factor [Brevundimonas alba]NJC41684.1 DNA-binding NarL/FixJ family response regulator [Brevundimonas alba]